MDHDLQDKIDWTREKLHGVIFLTFSYMGGQKRDSADFHWPLNCIKHCISMFIGVS